MGRFKDDRYEAEFIVEHSVETVWKSREVQKKSAESWWMPGWDDRAAPASAPKPGTTFNAPSGNPARMARSAKASAVRNPKAVADNSAPT